MKFRLGLFEDPFINCDSQREKNNVFTAEHRRISRDAARKSIILLKNNDDALPMNKSANIALIGRWAESADDMYDFWVANAKSNAYRPVTLMEGLRNAGGQFKYANGYQDDLKPNNVLIEEAVSLAAASDIVLVNIGISGKLAGEDRSIAMPEIPESQVDLLKALKKTGKKIVAVVSAGRPLVLTKAEPYCDAILYGWILGTEQGNALADVLYGNYNPSAKTVMTFPYAVGQIPVYYNHMNTSRPNPTDGQGNWYSRYRDIPNEPFYPFGYGLSFTRFSYSDLKLSKANLKKGETLEATVKVKNIGSREGEEIVQLYIRDLMANQIRPVKELKGFDKILLAPGQEKTVKFIIDTNMLSYYNSAGTLCIEPGEFHIFAGGNSRDVLQATLNYE
jgi:beta-glucosidase